MDPQKKKKIVIGAVAGSVVIVILILTFVFFPRGGGKGNGIENQNENSGSVPQSGSNAAGPTAGITQVASPQSAYDIAVVRAKQWEPDAGLMEVNLSDTSGGQWTFTFVSQKNKGKGLQVVVSGQAVASANQIAFEGAGTALPQNIISPDAAMADAHSIPGYANATFVSLQMIYSATAKQWYWGVKTANGVTLTIQATP